MSDTDDQQAPVRIRRAPRFSVFLLLGGIVGAVVALILTLSFPIDPKIGFGPIFGYFALFGIIGGVLVGAIVALILDRAATRRAQTLTASVAKLEPAIEAVADPVESAEDISADKTDV